MPFRNRITYFTFGSHPDSTTFSDYCQTDPNASDFGKCYTAHGRAYFVSPYNETPACVNDGTCYFVQDTKIAEINVSCTVDFTSVGKQAIIYEIFYVINTNNPKYAPFTIGNIAPHVYAYFDDTSLGRMSLTCCPVLADFSSSKYYDPQNNWFGAKNYFTTPTVGTQYVVKFSGTRFFQKMCINISNAYWPYESGNRAYYAGIIKYVYAYEASPELVLDFPYTEYIKYPELRSAVGYAPPRHPGWNAQDIISIMKDIFPNRVWMVYDDRTSTLYGWGITLEDLPDWLVSQFSPASFVVLKDKWDSNAVNAYISALNQYYVTQSSTT